MIPICLVVTSGQVKNQLNFYDFNLMSSGWQWKKAKKAMFWYVVPPDNLIELKKWIGPPLREKERVVSFKKKYKKTFVENGRVSTYVKRRYVDAEKLIKDVIKKDETIHEKVKAIKFLKC